MFKTITYKHPQIKINKVYKMAYLIFLPNYKVQFIILGFKNKNKI